MAKKKAVKKKKRPKKKKKKAVKKKKAPKKKEPLPRKQEKYLVIDEENGKVFMGSRSQVETEILDHLNEEFGWGSDDVEEKKELAESLKVFMVTIERELKVDLTFEPELHFVRKDASS